MMHADYPHDSIIVYGHVTNIYRRDSWLNSRTENLFKPQDLFIRIVYWYSP